MKRKFAAASLTVIACLLMLEFGLRVSGHTPTNIAEGIMEQYGDSFRHKRNITKTIKYPAFSYTIHTDEFGFRDRVSGPKNLEDRHFCAFLGASDVFGTGVDFSDSFVGIFADEASKRGMEVLNLAVGGHYFLDQEALLKDFIKETRLNPATVFFSVNALHIPKFDLMNKDIIVKNGYPIMKNGWRLTYLRILIGEISSAYCFFRDGIRRFQERYLNYELTEKSSEFLQIYFKGNKIRQPGRIKQFNDFLKNIESFCRERNIELIYVYVPLSDSFSLNERIKQLGLDPSAYDTGFYEELMRSHCAASGTRLINLEPALRRCYEEGKVLRFRLDPHFNRFANKVIGDSIVKEIYH